MRKSGTSVVVFLAAFCVAMSVHPAAAETVELELVLAVDVSASMNPAEAEMQRQGYISALTDPDFLRAVRSGADGKIAIAYLEWAGAGQQRLSVPWSIIDGEESARAFAARIPPIAAVNQQGTSIANAIDFAAAEISRNGYEGVRRTIDVSGDGPNNAGGQVELARDDAVRYGITINGLPIINAEGGGFTGVDHYYADCVVGGPGAFVMPAATMAEFASALRRKLILEVIGRTQDAPLIRPARSSDCLIGEKRRNRYIDRFFPQL
jgi:hypothetical protein